MEMTRRQVFSSLGSWSHLQKGLFGAGKKGENKLVSLMLNFYQFMENIPHDSKGSFLFYIYMSSTSSLGCAQDQ